MEAGTLNCPMCGAPVNPDATQCDHCGARLSGIQCPSCFGTIFAGSKFCPHCGAKTGQPETVDEPATKLCPRCRIPLNSMMLGATRLDECGKCNGMWVDITTLETIFTNSEKLATIDAAATGKEKPARFEPELDEIRYVPCPVCAKLMNRLNFGQSSGIIVDACKGHGTWFDPGELQHVVEFIRSGGLEESRRKEVARLEERERIRKASPPIFADVPLHGGMGSPTDRYSGLINLLAAAAYVLLRFVRW